MYRETEKKERTTESQKLEKDINRRERGTVFERVKERKREKREREKEKKGERGGERERDKREREREREEGGAG